MVNDSKGVTFGTEADMPAPIRGNGPSRCETRTMTEISAASLIPPSSDDHLAAAGDPGTAPLGAPADLAIGAFSDTGPWLVVPARLRWRRAVPSIRFAQRRELPELTRPRRIPPGLR